MFDKFEAAQRMSDLSKQRRQEEYLRKSHNALKNLIKRRLTTTFIGGLDSIEQRLGYLWGQHKPFDELNDREKVFYQLWKQLRKEILDKGNLQTKLALREVDLFEVELLDYEVNYNE